MAERLAMFPFFGGLLPTDEAFFSAQTSISVQLSYAGTLPPLRTAKLNAETDDCSERPD